MSVPPLKERPLLKGFRRSYVRCRRCGKRSYYDYVPYSLSNPIFTTPCGHDFRTDYEEAPPMKEATTPDGYLSLPERRAMQRRDRVWNRNDRAHRRSSNASQAARDRHLLLKYVEFLEHADTSPTMKKPKRPRKLSAERASAINRKRDLVEGTQRSYETKRVRVRPGRGKTVEE